MDAAARAWTERGFERFLFFSDAVVAIAISLLILPLVDIVNNDVVGVRDLVEDHWGQLFAFALSFVVIAQYWLLHHRLFETVTGYTPAIMWANMVWLASIVFLPLPTEMLGVDDSGSRAVHGMYIGSVLVTSVTLDLLRHVLSRTPGIRHDADLAPAGVVTTGLIAVALVVAVTIPSIGMAAMLLVFLSTPLQRGLRRRRSAGRP